MPLIGGEIHCIRCASYTAQVANDKVGRWTCHSATFMTR